LSKFIPLRPAKVGAGRGRTEGQTEGQTGVPDGGQTGARRGLDGGQTGARRGPDGARRGGGRKDYLLLKEKLTCSVYVSCKSSSASDVSVAGWM
jgi:hypothetical protein